MGQMLGLLLRLGRAIRRNRLRALGPLGVPLAALAALAALAGLAFAGDALLSPQAPGLPERAAAWTFWCMAASALVFGYTTFETLYRDRTGARLDRLPVTPESRYAWSIIRVYRVHLPLVLLPAVSGVTLLLHGDVAWWLLGVGDTLGALVFGLAAAILAHTVAGRSLVVGPSAFKGFLAQGFGPPETAFLYYSPAMALTASLVIGILVDLALQTGFARGVWGPLGVFGGLLTAAAAACLWKARAIFVAEHHLIAPRFADAEVLPAFKEGDLPRHTLGQGLEVLLPERARPLWRRDLRQYRRRYRVIPPLLVLASAALVAYASSTASAAGGALRTAFVAAAIGGLFFMPAFRVLGGELGARFGARALPVDPRDERRVQWLLAASEWGPLALAAGLASLVAGFGLASLGVVGVVALAFALANAAAIPWAQRTTPDVTVAAVAVRGGLVLVLGGASLIASRLA